MSDEKKILIAIIVILLVFLTGFISGKYTRRQEGSGPMAQELTQARGELQNAIERARFQGVAIRRYQETIREREDQLVERERIISALIDSEYRSAKLLEEGRDLNRDNIRGMAEYLGLTEGNTELE